MEKIELTTSAIRNTGKNNSGTKMFNIRNLGLSLVLAVFANPMLAQIDASEEQQIKDIEEVTIMTSPVVAEPIQVEIKEWPVPWENSRPRDPDVAPNGAIWLVGQAGDYAARFDPNSEEFSRKTLPPGTGPHNLIVDKDGSLWIAGNRQAYIGKMNSSTGELTRYTMPNDTAKDPHTMVFSGDDEIWFTMQWSNYVGRLHKKTGEVDLVTMRTEKARPYGIEMDAKGHPWVVLLGTNGLASIDPDTLELTVMTLAREKARLRRIAITDDGKVWYSDYTEGFIGRYDPATGHFKEWKTPSERSGPYAMAADADGRIWFVETWPQPNQLVGFDPATEKVFSVTPIPSGGGAVRHMVFDAKRNSLWFGTDTNNLAQAILP